MRGRGGGEVAAGRARVPPPIALGGGGAKEGTSSLVYLLS
jgi:hypothetical protein